MVFETIKNDEKWQCEDEGEAGDQRPFRVLRKRKDLFLFVDVVHVKEKAHDEADCVDHGNQAYEKDVDHQRAFVFLLFPCG